MDEPRTSKIAADGALMRRLAAGEEAAARELVARFARPLARFAATILNDPTEGEDIAHEAIMRLWRGAADWRPEGAIGGWLRRSVYTLSIDRLRRNRRFVDDPEGVAVANHADPRVDPEDAASGRQIGLAVEAAISSLPERQRAALRLAQFEGLSGVEIAEALETTPEAVESLLARARRALRQELSSAYADIGGALAPERTAG